MKSKDYLEIVGEIVQKLDQLGLNPVLVGGMALVILGSQRVTKDFDFLISTQKMDLETLLSVFYQHGLELVSKRDQKDNVTATCKAQKTALAKLRLRAPRNISFFNPATGLRVDLLLDFPLLADEVILHSETKKIRSCYFHIASKKDLIRLKELAYKDRRSATDAQDLEFLKKS